MLGSGTAAPERLRGLLDRRVPWKYVVVYALFIALLAGVGYSRVAPHEWSLQGSRVAAFTAAMQAREDGGPPLSQHCAPHLSRIFVKPGKWCPVGISDDQGMYLFVPYTADLLGQKDPKTTLRTAYIVFSVIAAFVWPLAFFALFGPVAAFFSPLLLVLAQHSLQSPDIYFVGGSAVLILIPLALLAARARARYAVPLLFGLVVLASAATAARNHAGLPVLVAALILLAIRRDWSRWGRAGACVLMLVAYVSVTPLGMNLVRHIRDSNRNAAVASDIARSHVFWHPIYLGLGYLPNDHKIWWNDAIGARKALSIDPKAVYPTQRYEHTIRGVVEDLVKHDPGFVAWMEIRKVAVAFGQVALALALLSVALALLVSRSGWRVLLEPPILVTLPALPIGVAQAVVGIPMVEYEQTWRAAIYLLFAFAVGILLRDMRLPRLNARIVAVAATGIVIAVGLFAWSNSLQDKARTWLLQGDRQAQQ